MKCLLISLCAINTLSVIVVCWDNLCNTVWHPDQARNRAWFGSKLFVTLAVFLKYMFWKKTVLWKIARRRKKDVILSSMREVNLLYCIWSRFHQLYLSLLFVNVVLKTLSSVRPRFQIFPLRPQDFLVENICGNNSGLGMCPRWPELLHFKNKSRYLYKSFIYCLLHIYS